MACNAFTLILFRVLELPKITLFKDLVGKIIEAKVEENCFFVLFRDFELNYLQNKFVI